MEIISNLMQVKQIDGSLVRIKSLYPQFTGKEKLIADHVLTHDDINYQTITQVVNASGSSYGSVDRFCKKMGYSGFQDFKIHLTEDLALRKANRKSDSSSNFSGRIATRVIEDIKNTLQVSSETLIEEAAQAILKARYVMIAGLSSSAGTASGIEYRLNRFGIRATSIVDNHIQRHQAATLGKEDVGVLISFSGSTKEILATGKIAKQSKATIISLSNYIESPISEIATTSLVTGMESDPLEAEIASKVAVEFVITLLFNKIESLMKNSRQLLTKTFEATADRQL